MAAVPVPQRIARSARSGLRQALLLALALAAPPLTVPARGGPAFPCPTPAAPAPAGSLPFGRWRAESTAGMAVLDVLTLTPERVRWGNAYNGRCDRAYAVEELPPGKGTYPDNLVRPASPTDLRFRVVRLRLQPGPCGRDAMVQLAIPLDGSDRMFVNSYAGDGSLTGWYGELNRLP